MAASRRLIPAILGIACLATTARTDYRAEHYAPWIQDLRDRLAVLHASLEGPSTELEANRKAALEESLAALDEPSASMQEDLTLLARAVKPLWSAYRDDPAVEDMVQYEMNLYWDALQERWREVQREDSPALVGTRPHTKGVRRIHSFFLLGRKMEQRARDSSYWHVRTWPWGSAAGQFLKAARLLDEAADLFALSREYTLVEGTVTATLGGVPHTWRMGSANRVVPTFDLRRFLDDPNYNNLGWKAYAIEPYSCIGPMYLFDPHPGDEYPKPEGDLPWPLPNAGVRIDFNPDVLGIPRDGQDWYEADLFGLLDDPFGVERRIVLETFDEGAGTASGTFRMTLFPSGGRSPQVLDGRFEIASGLRTYRR